MVADKTSKLECDVAHFCNDLCKRAIRRLDRAIAKIGKKISEEDSFTREAREWWDLIEESLIDIFESELDLIGKLREWVQKADQQKTLNRGQLEGCKAIVQETDRPARTLKLATPTYYGWRPTLTREKAKIRQLLVEHWHLLNALREVGVQMKRLFRYTSTSRQKLLEILEDCIKSLEGHLEKLKWLRTVFICYAHENTDQLQNLLNCEKQLNKKYIFFTYDLVLNQGSDPWHDNIQEALRMVDVAVAFVSNDFFESDYIKNDEISRLLDRRKTEGIRILPIILEKCPWKECPWLVVTQFLPSDNEYVCSHYSTGVKSKKLYSKATKQIERIMNNLSDPEKVQEFVKKF